MVKLCPSCRRAERLLHTCPRQPRSHQPQSPPAKFRPRPQTPQIPQLRCIWRARGRWEGDGRAMPSYSPLALLLSHRLPSITMPQTLVTIGCITIAIARHTRAPRCPLPIALARCCTSAPTSVVWAQLIRATHLHFSSRAQAKALR
jgi:hypothetical protein